MIQYNNSTLSDNAHTRRAVETTAAEARNATETDGPVLVENLYIVPESDVSAVRQRFDGLPRYYETTEYPNGVYIRYNNQIIVVQFLVYG